MAAKASGIACANIGLAAAGESDLSHHQVEVRPLGACAIQQARRTDAARFVAFMLPLRLPGTDA
jgi:hypothetical protein